VGREGEKNWAEFAEEAWKVHTGAGRRMQIHDGLIVRGVGLAEGLRRRSLRKKDRAPKSRPLFMSELKHRSPLLCRGGAGAEVAVEEVDDGEGDEGAGGVEEGVPCGGGAGGDKGLVDFVEGGISGGDKPGGPGPGPAPTGVSGANAAKEDHIEDEILGEVRGLADEVMDYLKLGSGEMRNEGVKNGIDDRRGVIGGEVVGGEGKDEAGPKDCGPPRAEPLWNDGLTRGAMANFVEIGCRAGIAPGFGCGQTRLL
jgi:hypothetical protein